MRNGKHASEMNMDLDLNQAEYQLCDEFEFYNFVLNFFSEL